MIPYFDQPTLPLGPVTIHGFGVLVAISLLVGAHLFVRRCERSGLDLAVGRRLTTWVVISGFAGAHAVDSVFYNLEQTLADPLTLFRFWDGLSSYGGLAGGAIGASWFFRRYRQGDQTWRYLDALAYAFPFAFILGRLGCFVAFDHVGAPTHFFLGQQYVDGIVRHNLGLEEALYWIPIAAIIAVLGRTSREPGFFVGAIAVLYAPGRFMLDFLRVSDTRHAGLLVSQYASILLFAIGLWVLWRVRTQVGASRDPNDEPSDHDAARIQTAAIG